MILWSNFLALVATVRQGAVPLNTRDRTSKSTGTLCPGNSWGESPNGISGSDSTICAHLLHSQAVRGHNDSTARRARNVAELKLARDDQHVFIIHASIFKLRGRHLRIYLHVNQSCMRLD
ncbi:hypothetical protein CY34DRAFT_804185 [Suillus luteus UH-Slu-Lm8-n1]|uniref:Unplaced genomic scaffold CY34scaffold_90, whole genome shotgun sequence n=1 Tax=Suillus luteus UH-Slu-Lm8-n1 TaxID=930992 RepID=A0A0D0AMP8_9AGAM|nr:hypothetical protein CY34DRAFT_804185 [Suillus luteus UH-Slu-Lm8-n1]